MVGHAMAPKPKSQTQETGLAILTSKSHSFNPRTTEMSRYDLNCAVEGAERLYAALY